MEVGRLVAAIAKAGEMENTLILYIVGDNGASREGGLEGTVIGGKFTRGWPYVDGTGGAVTASPEHGSRRVATADPALRIT